MNTTPLWSTSLLAAMIFSSGCASPWRPIAGNGSSPPTGSFSNPRQIEVPGDPPALRTDRLPGNAPSTTPATPTTPASPKQSLTPPYQTNRPAVNDSLPLPGEWKAAPVESLPSTTPAFRPDPQDLETWKPVEKPLDGINRPLKEETENPAASSGAGVGTEANPNTTMPRLDIPESSIHVPGGRDAGLMSRPVSQEEIAAGATPTAMSNIITGDIGRSEQGLRIEFQKIGNPGLRVLVLGSLNGNEADTVRFVEAVSTQLRRETDFLRERSIVLIPTPNPDGLQDGTLTNSHGVNLNRNFPSPNFTTRPTTQTGPRGASEAETRALVQALTTFRPHRVVLVQTGPGEKPLLTANARALEGLRLRATGQEVAINHFDNLYKIGSLEEYVSQELKAEMIVITLPLNSAELQRDPSSLLYLVLDGSAPDALPSTGNNSIEDRPLSRVAPSVSDVPSKDVSPRAGVDNAPSKPDGAKGYVTLLPPPPEFALDDENPRYFELPPPE